MKRRVSLSVVITVLSALTVATTAFYVNDERQQAHCQAKFNEQFATQLRERNKISDSDRESLAVLVKAVVNAKDRASSRQALENYLKTKDKNDDERRQHPLPDLPEEGETHC